LAIIDSSAQGFFAELATVSVFRPADSRYFADPIRPDPTRGSTLPVANSAFAFLRRTV